MMASFQADEPGFSHQAKMPEVQGPEELPTDLELFRRQVYVCFWFEQLGPTKLLEDVGVDNVLFETDYPHPTCLYPNNEEHAASVLAGWPEEVRRKVLQDNAAKLYRIPVGVATR